MSKLETIDYRTLLLLNDRLDNVIVRNKIHSQYGGYIKDKNGVTLGDEDGIFRINHNLERSSEQELFEYNLDLFEHISRNNESFISECLFNTNETYVTGVDTWKGNLYISIKLKNGEKICLLDTVCEVFSEFFGTASLLCLTCECMDDVNRFFTTIVPKTSNIEIDDIGGNNPFDVTTYKPFKKFLVKKRVEKSVIQKYRGLINQHVLNKGYHKNDDKANIFGCDYPTLMKHIESLFEPGMHWGNRTTYGWHLDHIKPISVAETEEDLVELSHYKNLQPLWAEDNLKKSDSINK